ncbi:DUF2249 domain-containing protein [Demequina sp. NBRC 110057]|uniref:DUF2249 domain-containing protein n=1 Tax=Demequina sp. NBRC 110057 TaxID=1570346 RepID=UPI0009FFDC52|nr:DUF2249 domain-containing protein [Demequina sp. NBRC 110057]
MRDGGHTLIDEIDLIALGHMPGGAALARPRPLAHLDLTGLDPQAARQVALAEVARLVPGDTIIVVTADAPFALLDALHSATDGRCLFEYLATGPEAWATAVSRLDS